MTDHHLTGLRPVQPATPGRGPRLNRAATLGLTVALVAVTGAVVLGRNASSSCARTPVSAQAVADLGRFVRWLRAQHVRGYVGEVGWPSGRDAQRWNQVAGQWYQAADRAGLWVTAWAAGAWWPKSYRMAVYRFDNGSLDKSAQSSVVEAHAHEGDALRGVDLPSAAFGSGPERPFSYSSATPGRAGRDYYYDSAADMRLLADSGASLVRLSVTWERLQPRLGGPLDASELARLRDALRAAEQAGLGVVLDLHGYGDYWAGAPGGGHRRLTLGSRALPDTDFADFWRRMSTALRGSTAVLGYGLMNEPMRLDRDPHAGVLKWQAASQAAVDAIRGTGDRRLVMVSGYGGASPDRFAQYQPRAWVDDPAGQVRYEVHQYFDSDHTGLYSRSFSEETRRARAAGFVGGCSRAGTTTAGRPR